MKLLRVRHDAEGRKVTVEMPGEGTETVGMDVTDSTALFEAGISIIEAASWLSRVEFDQHRSKVEALALEGRASGELQSGR